MITRRLFLTSTAAALAPAAPPALKLGVMDGVLRLTSKPDAVASAASFGVDGLQVTIGRAEPGAPMPLADRALQTAFRDECARHRVRLVATYLDILHTHCLKSDPLARDRVAEAIDITRALGSPILMTVFFGKCSPQDRAEQDRVIEAFRELAPVARRARVILGYENVLPVDDNLRALDRVGSSAFRIYYDVGNATHVIHEDPVAAIRRLGRDGMCQLHLKDKGYLGEGAVDFPKVIAALREISYSGYAVLETSSPSKDAAADLRRNLAYLRGL